MKANENEWCVIALSILSLECECRKEFQVVATSLKQAATRAEKVLKAQDGDWKIKSIWWLDPNRTILGTKK